MGKVVLNILLFFAKVVHSCRSVAAESVFIFCLFWFRRSVIGSMLFRVCELSAPSLARLSAISFPLYPL